MNARRASALLAAVAVVSVLGMAAPAAGSPAPVAGCPPCGSGFVSSAASHGLDTGVEHSEAVVQVHRNGSATWTVRVVPTNGTVLDRLAENRSLALSVAGDSFGTRYGEGIEHELVDARVVDGAFLIQYRTLDVVHEGPFDTQVLTYFRDSPGAHVYTELGADELTVVAPEGMTVASGFGEVSDDRMTATELPGVRDGPFVVFAPKGSLAPGLVGALAIASSLAGVVVRNLAYFVALPGSVLIGGFAGIRRVLDAGTGRNPARLGGAVAAGGAVLLAGTLLTEADALPQVTGNLFIGGLVGIALLAAGAPIAAEGTRRHLTPFRLLGVGIAVGIVAATAPDAFVGASSFHRSLSLTAALLPAAAGLGWADAQAATGDGPLPDRFFTGISALVVAALVATAPLTALGGALFLLLPILLTVAAAGFVVAAIPLYLLGAAGANARAERAE